MKRLLLLPALATAVLFLPSCANNSSAATASSGNGGGGSLSYTIDGTKTVVTPPLTIYENEVSHNTAKGTVKVRVTIFPAGELLDLHVADKGTTSVVHYRPSFTQDAVSAEYMSHSGHNFYADNATVSITAADAAHVAGTFSGTFTGDEGKTVTITDGSFDLPTKAKN